MAHTTFQGNPVDTAGQLPPAGAKAPDFSLTATDLSAKSAADYAGKNLVLNIFPSIDTPVCAASVRRFNQEAGALPNTVVLCVSADLPFAHQRFCGAEGLNNVVSLSCFRSPEFGKAYGVAMTSAPLNGLLARAVIIIDPTGTVIHSQLVPEITTEPDYAAALQTLQA